MIELWITTIATVVIAIYAVLSYRLTSKIKAVDEEYRKRSEEKDDEYRQQVSDLFQAITISNLLHGLEGASAFSTIENKIREFNKIYKGNTNIFD